MQNFYDFQGKINAMNHIFRQHVSNAEKINAYLQKMSPEMVKKIVKQLKQEYENQYNSSDTQQKQKLTSIKNTLNLAASEQTTNLDVSYLLKNEINKYYKRQYFNIKKQIPFLLQCDICHKYVSNDRYTRELHKSKCRKAKQRIQIAAPQRKNYKKKADTIQKYQERQKLVIESVHQSSLQKICSQEQMNQKGIITSKKKVSKSETIKLKKQQKSAKELVQSINRQFGKINNNQQQCIEEKLSSYFSQLENEYEIQTKINRNSCIEQLFSRKNYFKQQQKNGQLQQLKKPAEVVQYQEQHDQFFEGQ